MQHCPYQNIGEVELEEFKTFVWMDLSSVWWPAPATTIRAQITTMNMCWVQIRKRYEYHIIYKQIKYILIARFPDRKACQELYLTTAICPNK